MRQIHSIQKKQAWYEQLSWAAFIFAVLLVVFILMSSLSTIIDNHSVILMIFTSAFSGAASQLPGPGLNHELGLLSVWRFFVHFLPCAHFLCIPGIDSGSSAILTRMNLLLKMKV